MLRDMTEEQRGLAYALMATGLTEDSNRQAQLIIEHEDVLGPLEQEAGRVTFLRDTLWYAWTIFGDPAGDAEPWGWRVEGHHVSLHYSIWGDRVLSVTPFFFGANPAEVRKGPKEGLRILGASQDIALELMESLDAGQKSKAIIYDEAPADIITFNSSKASLPKEEGLSAIRHVRHAARDADVAGQRVRHADSLRPGRGEAERPARGRSGEDPPGLGRPRGPHPAALLPAARRRLRG